MDRCGLILHILNRNLVFNFCCIYFLICLIAGREAVHCIYICRNLYCHLFFTYSISSLHSQLHGMCVMSALMVCNHFIRVRYKVEIPRGPDVGASQPGGSRSKMSSSQTLPTKVSTYEANTHAHICTT